jgi:hypothetical protein
MEALDSSGDILDDILGASWCPDSELIRYSILTAVLLKRLLLRDNIEAEDYTRLTLQMRLLLEARIWTITKRVLLIKHSLTVFAGEGLYSINLCWETSTGHYQM